MCYRTFCCRVFVDNIDTLFVVPQICGRLMSHSNQRRAPARRVSIGHWEHLRNQVSAFLFPLLVRYAWKWLSDHPDRIFYLLGVQYYPDKTEFGLDDFKQFLRAYTGAFGKESVVPKESSLTNFTKKRRTLNKSSRNGKHFDTIGPGTF